MVGVVVVAGVVAANVRSRTEVLLLAGSWSLTALRAKFKAAAGWRPQCVLDTQVLRGRSEVL